MKTLIITEKPKVSQRIARALSDKPVRKRFGPVGYFQFSENGDEVYVASAAGHLYSLKQNGEGYDFPVFDISWKPLFEIDKSKYYTKGYIDALKGLAKDADSFIIATDWDIEGELLGYNALRFSREGATAKRMRFSTLVSHDLRKAYENLSEVDRGLVEAGETRHILDWYWGINLSRALMHSTRLRGGRFTISAGRVQTPALSVLVKREREIAAFVSEKFYELQAKLKVGKSTVTARHRTGRFNEKEEAEKVLTASQTERALVTSVEQKIVDRYPLVPFDLGELQSEAFRVYRYNPKRTQELAQTLYEGGLISYPRTSSQKYPPGIGFKRVIEAMAGIKGFEIASKLLEKEKLYPRQGKKDDPAHPAIYPTGVPPKELNHDQERLYKLVVHRFLAAFADKAQLEKNTAQVELNDQPYVFDWTRILSRGWMEYYPYVKVDVKELSPINKGDMLAVLGVELKEGETQPPKRFNPASLIRTLEEKGLGTKATRAEVVDTLYRRRYIRDVPINVTHAGSAVIEALENYVPEIIDEALTRRFEEQVEKIQGEKLSKEVVLKEAQENLLKILAEFKEKEENIGKTLIEAFTKTTREQDILGACPTCEGELRIVRSPKTGKSFVGCTKYPECRTSYPLPQRIKVKPSDETCAECGLPLVRLGFKGKRVLSCIDLKCPSKQKR